MNTLMGVNVVALARSFNPSIFSTEWLFSRAKLPGGEKDFLYTPAFCSVQTDVVSFVVTEDRLQVNANQADPQSLKTLCDLVERIVDLLPETPYRAVGLNLTFGLSGANYHRESLVLPNQERIEELIGGEFALGVKLRFPFDDFVTTLDVGPEGVESVQARFNFHADVSQPEALKQRLGNSARVLEKAQSIIRGITSHGD